MNIEEAKLILSAYRPDGRDADDPQFREALELTKHDPDLARWFAEARAWDARVGAKMRHAASPPPELKSALLAQQKIIRPFPWWRRPAWEWNGHKVSLLCFELENRRMAHLLVVNRSALRDPPGSAPEFARHGTIATAAWSQGERVYLLASHGALQSELAELL